ncbi:myosin-4-like protein [Lates japonicus]|uniref:Myosin-4-like protein n=1 Tax=Lates japonicus TaxID=270547 RepID=A0AAD3QVF5_LATJO|nr:myosin-4-like protein [Lates japonicus]
MEAEAAVSPLSPSVQCLFEMDLRPNTSPDMDTTKQSFLQIPELVFHQFLDERDQKIYLLGREKQALIKKAEQLRKELAEICLVTHFPVARLVQVLSGLGFELSEGHSLDIWMDVRASAADGQ